MKQGKCPWKKRRANVFRFVFCPLFISILLFCFFFFNYIFALSSFNIIFPNFTYNAFNSYCRANIFYHLHHHFFFRFFLLSFFVRTIFIWTLKSSVLKTFLYSLHLLIWLTWQNRGNHLMKKYNSNFVNPCEKHYNWPHVFLTLRQVSPTNWHQ